MQPTLRANVLHVPTKATAALLLALVLSGAAVVRATDGPIGGGERVLVALELLLAGAFAVPRTRASALLLLATAASWSVVVGAIAPSLMTWRWLPGVPPSWFEQAPALAYSAAGALLFSALLGIDRGAPQRA